VECKEEEKFHWCVGRAWAGRECTFVPALVVREEDRQVGVLQMRVLHSRERTAACQQHGGTRCGLVLFFHLDRSPLGLQGQWSLFVTVNSLCLHPMVLRIPPILLPGWSGLVKKKTRLRRTAAECIHQKQKTAEIGGTWKPLVCHHHQPLTRGHMPACGDPIHGGAGCWNGSCACWARRPVQKEGELGTS
jgi:hypothetical protein